MKLNSSRISSLAATLAVALLAGCGTTEPPAEPLIRTPKSGSSFNFVSYQKDSTGAIVPQTMNNFTRRVLNTNATVMGKSNVVQYLDGSDTFNIRYEGNGDVMFLQPEVSYPGDNFPAIPGLPSGKLPARWVTFPYGSKNPIAIESFDTTLSLPGTIPIPINVKMTGSTSYIGTEDLTVGTEKVATQKGLLKVDVNFSAFLLGSGKITTIDTLWFAPKLGMFVRDDAFSTGELPEQFGGKRSFGGAYSTMTSYSLQ